MKTLLTFLLITAAVFAADAVSVDGNMNVIIAGSNQGRAEDFIDNNPSRKTEVMLAIRAFNTAAIAKAQADANTARDAAITAKEAEKTFAIAAANAAKVAAETAKTAAEQSQAAAVTARQAAESARAAETTRVAAIVAALKGVSPTLLPAAVRAELRTAQEKERDALLAQKAALDAQVAALP